MRNPALAGTRTGLEIMTKQFLRRGYTSASSSSVGIWMDQFLVSPSERVPVTNRRTSANLL